MPILLEILSQQQLNVHYQDFYLIDCIQINKKDTVLFLIVLQSQEEVVYQEYQQCTHYSSHHQLSNASFSF